MINKEYAFVIPAYNPNKKLLDVVKNLNISSKNKIFIIDDGSNYENKYIFEKLIAEKNNNNCIFFKNELNLGKGATLKKVFSIILKEYTFIQGVVTVDCDGQHSTIDCIRVMEKLIESENTLILGYRSFDKNVPIKSYIGNEISKFLFSLFMGRNFFDTQTGLRGLSKKLMSKCLSIKSDRFDFETEVLAKATEPKSEFNIIEIPIKTIYLENNASTSFRPLIDSFKIFLVLFRYGIYFFFSKLFVNRDKH